METQLFKRITDIAYEAGRISLKYLEDSHPQLKADQSVITEADTAISKLVHESLKDLIQSSEHVIIDEESQDNVQLLDRKVLSQVPYIWAVDPIDGTRIYANKISHYAVSIGLIKDLKPWMGVVYFPGLSELFVCDGQKAYFVKNAFTSDEINIQIKPIDQKISSHSLFLCDDAVYRDFNWDYKDCQILVSGSAVADLCWPAIGRGCGGLFHSNIWDFAGSWPIVEKAGLKLRSMNTGEELSKIDIDLFETGQSSWKVRDYYILSSERNFKILKNKLKQKMKR